METETMDLAFDAETLVGDLRDGMLKELSVAHTKPWGERPEAEQRAVAERIHNLARQMVREAVTTIVDNGFPQLPGKLESVAVKDGFKAAVKFSPDVEDWPALIRAQGRNVVLVVAEPEQYFGTRGAVPIRPDQAPLPYADEAAAVADAAEQAPDGWPVETTGVTEGEDPVTTPENTPPNEPEPPLAEPVPDEGVPAAEVMPDPTAYAVMQQHARFHVAGISDGAATWFCWKDADGKVRCHEDAEQAGVIAARQKASALDEDWDGPEERDTKRRRRQAAG